MAKGKRLPQEINAGSMADIAFLLLVFFLVTTTMDSDWGIARLLPPNDLEETEIKIKERNVFVVLVNANDQLLVEGEILDISQLKDKAKEFIVNPSNREDLPEKQKVTVSIANQKLATLTKPDKVAKWKKLKKAAEMVGEFWDSKQVISLQNDRGTSYNMYIQVQNELAAAYHELRQDLARQKFGEEYDDITEKAKSDKEYKKKYKIIKTIYPQKISEAEPKNVGQ